jgi:hypothetical protein
MHYHRSSSRHKNACLTKRDLKEIMAQLKEVVWRLNLSADVSVRALKGTRKLLKQQLMNQQ